MSWFLMLPTEAGGSREQALLLASPCIPAQLHFRYTQEIFIGQKVMRKSTRLLQRRSFQQPLLWLTSHIPSSTCWSVSNQKAPWHRKKGPAQLGKLLHLQLDIPCLNSTNLRPFVITISTLKIFPSVRYFPSQVPVKSFEINSVIESVNYFLSSSPSVMFI